MRGLKLEFVNDESRSIGRTFTGAWIETTWRISACKSLAVAPLRVRGLKHNPKVVLIPLIKSHLYGCVD